MDQLPFSLDEVVIDSELLRRPSRPPDHEAENEAFIVLAQTLADSPDMILQKLPRRLCNFAAPIRLESACWRSTMARRCLGGRRWREFSATASTTRCPEMQARAVQQLTETPRSSCIWQSVFSRP